MSGGKTGIVLKVIGIIIMIIGIITSVIMAFKFGVLDIELLGVKIEEKKLYPEIFFPILIGGIISSCLAGLVLFGLGTIVENTKASVELLEQIAMKKTVGPEDIEAVAKTLSAAENEVSEAAIPTEEQNYHTQLPQEEEISPSNETIQVARAEEPKESQQEEPTFANGFKRCPVCNKIQPANRKWCVNCKTDF